MDALLSWPRPARSPAGLCVGLRATAKRGRLSQPRRGRCPAELWAAIRTGSKRGCEVSQRSQATHVTPAAVVVVATRVCRAVCAWHKVTHIRHHALGVMSRARALGRGYSRLCNDLAESSSRWHGGCGRHRTCTCVCDDPLRAAPRPHCCACGLPASPGPRCSRVLGPLSKKRRLAPRLARQALASASPSPPPTRPDKPTVPEPRANPRPLCRDRSRQPWQQPGVARQQRWQPPTEELQPPEHRQPRVALLSSMREAPEAQYRQGRVALLPPSGEAPQAACLPLMDAPRAPRFQRQDRPALGI
jgi:hypothetical protein